MMLGTHVETNEDRKRYDHPGYVALPCVICGETTMKAVGADHLSCGRMECMTLAGDVLAKGRA